MLGPREKFRGDGARAAAIRARESIVRSRGTTRVVRRIAVAAGVGFARVDPGRGRFDFAERGPIDAATDGATPDALGTCNAAAAFGMRVALAELNDPAHKPAHNDGTLPLLPDERPGYFWTFRGNAAAQDYLATCPDLATPFAVASVQSRALAGSALGPTISVDGSLLVVRRDSPGDDLNEATRTSPDTFNADADQQSRHRGGRGPAVPATRRWRAVRRIRRWQRGGRARWSRPMG